MSFSKLHKKSINNWATFERIFLPRTFKNWLIWSHCFVLRTPSLYIPISARRSTPFGQISIKRKRTVRLFCLFFSISDSKPVSKFTNLSSPTKCQKFGQKRFESFLAKFQPCLPDNPSNVLKPDYPARPLAFTKCSTLLVVVRLFREFIK